MAHCSNACSLVNLYRWSSAIVCRSKWASLGGKRSCLELINDYFLYDFLQIEGRAFLFVPPVGCIFSLLDLLWLGQPPFSMHLCHLHPILSYMEGLQEDLGAASAAACLTHQMEGRKKKGREEGPLLRNKALSSIRGGGRRNRNF